MAAHKSWTVWIEGESQVNVGEPAAWLAHKVSANARMGVSEVHYE
jgi:hypothetical protein